LINIKGSILGLASILVAFSPVAASEGTTDFGMSTNDITIQVQSADGKLLPHAVGVCVGGPVSAIVNGDVIEGGSQRFQTDGEGRFSLPLTGKNFAVAVAGSNGFCLMQTRDLVHHPSMIVQPGVASRA
jgi:hypothetical protein